MMSRDRGFSAWRSSVDVACRRSYPPGRRRRTPRAFRCSCNACIGFDHIPAEQREYFIEAGIAVQVGVVEIGEAAVAEPDVGRHQRQSRLYRPADAVAVLVEERAGVDVRLPLVHGNLDAKLHRWRAAQSTTDRRGKAVHQHVVPLVKHVMLPIAVREARKSEAAVGIALGEREVFAVRIAEADVALGEPKCVVAAAVQPLDPACGSCAPSVTMPVTVLRSSCPASSGRCQLHTPARRSLMIFGLAKPIETWYPAGPNSWK